MAEKLVCLSTFSKLCQLFLLNSRLPSSAAFVAAERFFLHSPALPFLFSLSILNQIKSKVVKVVRYALVAKRLMD